MPVITYPGITGVVDLSIEASVGITPAPISITCQSDSNPSLYGHLVIGDGTNANILFANCRLDYEEAITSGSQDHILVRLLDRRWQWKDSFAIDGHYNQMDGNKKLIPTYVRSLYQLARLLLARMGEYPLAMALPAGTIDLPPGLASKPVAGLLPELGPGDRLIDAAGEFLALGQNLPATRTNPIVLWESQPAALALANLIEPFGRVVVWDPISDSVRIVALGNGTPLPVGGVIVSTGDSATGEAIPANIIIRGAPTRYQWRVAMRPVCREYDGSWQLPSRVSYAPTRAGQAMVVRIDGTYNAGWDYAVVLNGVGFLVGAGSQPNFVAVVDTLVAAINGSADPSIAGKVIATRSSSPTRLTLTGVATGYEFEVLTTGSTVGLIGTFPTESYGWFARCTVGPISGPAPQMQSNTISFGSTYAVGDTWSVTINGVTFTTTGQATAYDTYYDLFTQIFTSVDAAILNVVTPSCNGSVLLITGVVAGTAFTCTAMRNGTPSGVNVTVVSPVTFTPNGFEKCFGSFGVFARATANLTQKQAARLADDSVYRCYQIVAIDPSDRSVKSIPTPGYPALGSTGTMTNRYRLLLESSRPQTITPAPGDANVVDATTGVPYAVEQYNGYAVDRPNIAFGSVWLSILDSQLLRWTGADYFRNTFKRSYLPIPFQVIDPERGVIQFTRPVFRVLGTDQDGMASGAAALPSDIVIECGVQVLDDPSGVPARYSYTLNVGGPAPDIEKVFGDVQLEVIGKYNSQHKVTGSFVQDADARNRASYYAASLAAALQIPTGTGTRYEGILSIPLDGLVRQIQWSIGLGGCFTQVSTNSEFSRNIIPFPLRRRNENLNQDAIRAAQNLATDFRLRGEVTNAIKRIAGSLLGGVQ